jgi:hypothetical protein
VVTFLFYEDRNDVDPNKFLIPKEYAKGKIELNFGGDEAGEVQEQELPSHNQEKDRLL